MALLLSIVSCLKTVLIVKDNGFKLQFIAKKAIMWSSYRTVKAELLEIRCPSVVN